MKDFLRVLDELEPGLVMFLILLVAAGLASVVGIVYLVCRTINPAAFP